MTTLFKSITILFFIYLFLSCKLPKDTIIFSNYNTVYNKRKLNTIPQQWDGRLLAISQQFQVGGDSLHRHTIQHEHTDTSESPNSIMNPLGLVEPTASGSHKHIIETYFQSPIFSGQSNYQPLSKELNTYITKRGINKVPDKIILLYIGKNTPKGWVRCDGTNSTPKLNETYIKLKQKDCSGTPGGNNSHVHSIDHTHKWSVHTPDNTETPNINEALAGDEIPHPGDTIKIDEFNHIHGIIEEKLNDTFTIPKEVFPPSLSVCFIQSTKYSKKIPKHAILPTIKDSKSWGWSEWKPKFKSNLNFIYSVSDSSKVLSEFGSLSHRHVFDHTHKITLISVPIHVLRVSQGVGPSVSLSSHTHEVYAHKEVITDTSSSLPLFVSFKFIIKK